MKGVRASRVASVWIYRIFPTFGDIAALDDKISKLTVDVNTQALQVEIEWIKCQKLRMTLKHVKRELAPSDHLLSQFRQELNILKEQLGTIRNLYESETARVGTTTYGCFARLHQVMIAIVRYIPMPVTEHNDISHLIY